jgi:hypothetical protein
MSFWALMGQQRLLQTRNISAWSCGRSISKDFAQKRVFFFLENMMCDVCVCAKEKEKEKKKKK